MQTNLVVGLGFGDEGKGRVVSSLVSSDPDAIVVRYCGGHQAGHTVVKDRLDTTKPHVFSSFGSGTLHGAPTYWSRFCTFYPWAVRNEFNRLQELGVTPTLYVDALCPVTTNFDVAHNKIREEKVRHGSVGVGIGSTFARHEAFYKLYFQDLFNVTVLRAKLDNIMLRYYSDTVTLEWEDLRDKFLQSAAFIRDCANIHLVQGKKIDFNKYDNVIFEGAQGILLDQDFGFFPNVTRGNTTSKNAVTLLKEFNLPRPRIYRLTRTYQTRHGNGFMSNEDKEPLLIHTEQETNTTGPWQGPFRKGCLDLDLIRYAVQCDQQFTGDRLSTLVVTCVDQLGTCFPVTSNQRLVDFNLNEPEQWQKELRGCRFDSMMVSESRFTEPLLQLYDDVGDL